MFLINHKNHKIFSISIEFTFVNFFVWALKIQKIFILTEIFAYNQCNNVCIEIDSTTYLIKL